LRFFQISNLLFLSHSPSIYRSSFISEIKRTYFQATLSHGSYTEGLPVVNQF
jgi:hypothetical protein